MSTAFLELRPVLVSELPPSLARPGLLGSLRARVVRRMGERTFERALRGAGHAEQTDLLALARRG